MKSTNHALHFVRHSLGIAVMAMLCGHALTAGAQDRTEKQQRFEADVQACRSGKTGQNFDACMKEAKAVYAAPVAAGASGTAEQRQRAELLRCDVFTGDERTACVARLSGEATVSGSVAGCGILRETITTEIVPPNATAPAAAGSQ